LGKRTPGGFFPLDDVGMPLPVKPGHAGAERQIHDTARMVHCYAIAHMLGFPGADRIVDHGMTFLWRCHRDQQAGGYFWAVDDEQPTNATKQAYGHGFVLLAASSAKVVGHPDANRLIADITDVLHTRFWDKSVGATTEEYAADWQPLGNYRGQNSNMHLSEATMAAFEATGDRTYLGMAESIASLIIDRHAREQGWRVAEHFDSNWQVDRNCAGMEPPARPALGTRRTQAWLDEGRSEATFPQHDGNRLESRDRRFLLHARLGRPAGPGRPLLVALRGRHSSGGRTGLGRSRPTLRGVVSSHLGFCNRPFHRPRTGRLVS
jgi:hypothetical protein